MKKEINFWPIYGMGMSETKDKPEKGLSGTVVTNGLSVEKRMTETKNKGGHVGYHAEWFWHVK